VRQYAEYGRVIQEIYRGDHMSNPIVYVSINLKTPISFEEARCISAPIKHYITEGGSDKIAILVVTEESKETILNTLKDMKIAVV